MNFILFNVTSMLQRLLLRNIHQEIENVLREPLQRKKTQILGSVEHL